MVAERQQRRHHHDPLPRRHQVGHHLGHLRLLHVHPGRYHPHLRQQVGHLLGQCRGGRLPGRIGERAFDTPLTDLVRDDDGWARARLRGPAGRLELAVDEAWPWLLVYSGDQLPEGQRRRSLALEPMSCPNNALADDVDVVVLEPGETWAGSWSVAWTPAV